MFIYKVKVALKRSSLINDGYTSEGLDSVIVVIIYKEINTMRCVRSA